MGSLRAAPIANSEMGYIEVLILTVYAKADLGKEIKEAILNEDNATNTNLIKITIN